MKKKRKFTKCQICGVSVNINNLADHLGRVHNKALTSAEAKEHQSIHPEMKVNTEEGGILNVTAYERRYEKGLKLMLSERFERAIEVLKTIPEEYQEISDVYSLIGISYIQLERIEDAITYFGKAVKADPNCPAHRYNLNAAYFREGYVAKSRECLNKALELNPDEETKKNAEKLMDCIKELLNLELANKPDLDVETYLMLEERFHKAVEFMNNKNWDAAIEEFKYVANVDKASMKAHGNLGIIYFIKGDLEEAEKHLVKSLEIDPEYTLHG